MPRGSFSSKRHARKGLSGSLSGGKPARRSAASNKRKGNIGDFGSGVKWDSDRGSRSSRRGGGKAFGVSSSKRDKRSSRRRSPAGRDRRSAGRRNSAIVVVGIAVAALGLFLVVDSLITQDRVHSRVSVGGLDVGGMTVQEAAAAIDEAFSDQVADGSVTLYADEESAESGVTPVEILFDYESLQSYEETPPEGSAFSIDPSIVDAEIDSQALAQRAYEIGRGRDFVLGRLKAAIFGTDVSLEVSFDDSLMEALAGILDSSLGYTMVNPDIVFQDGAFTTTAGNDGYMVVRDELTDLLSEALLSESHSLVIPMSEVEMQVTDSDAEQAAETANEAIADSLVMTYDDDTGSETLEWTLDSSFLGQSISTFVRSGLFGNSLVPYVSSVNLESLISTLDGMSDLGTPAENVQFSYDGEELSYTDAQTGIGPDYPDIAAQMNAFMFFDSELCVEAGEVEASSEAEDEDEDGAEQSGSQSDESDGEESDQRIVEMSLDISYPEITYEDAVDLGLTSNMISSYTTEFTSSGNKAINIKLLADILTNTLLAPGETFSLNDIAGECNEEKGFQEAGAIVNGRIESAIGGGICQVATTVYDAVFFAGYPVDERYNHSTYVSSYEDGMDSAIAYPYLDLKFTNDTDNYLLVLVDYTDSTVTCSLWGIDPGYEVDYEMTNWEEGESYDEVREIDETLAPGVEVISSYGSNGHSVTIVRWVYSAEGELLHEDTFVSNYSPSSQVVLVGPQTSSTESD